jgi:hypothetical protein
MRATLSGLAEIVSIALFCGTLLLIAILIVY